MASGSGRVELTEEEIAGLTDAELAEALRSRLREPRRSVEAARLRVAVGQAWAEFDRIRAERRSQTFSRYSEADSQFFTSVCLPFYREFSPRREPTVWPLSPLKIQLLRRILPAGVDLPPSDASFLKGEILRRLGDMLRASRMALGLTKKQVSRRSNIVIERIQAAEQGSDFEVDPYLFERACTEGELNRIDRVVGDSLWGPLLDHLFCRTIPKVAVDVDPDWLTRNNGSAMDLARTIFRDRDFQLLPILGDALEEAGCVDPAILDHCRTPGEHARGCWVVDALVSAGRRG